MEKNLYDILGVDKNSSPDEIKSAYRKLSMQHHPDKNNGSKESEDKFKEIAEAYDTLSDPQKKQNYDMFGSKGGQNFQSSPFDMEDIFSQFGDIFGSFNGRRQNRRRKGSDLRVKVSLTLKEIIFGADKKIKYKRQIKCNTCDGHGGTNITSCSGCNGTGQKVFIQQTQFGRIQQSGACTECDGTGKKIQNKCITCHGNGTILNEEILDIKIPPGMLNGMQLSMQGNGNHIKDGEPGDIYIAVEEIQDPKFVRDGTNLQYNQYISISDAVLGTQIEIETPHGINKINIPSGCDSGKIFSVKGKGIPNLSNNGNVYGYGDLNIKVNVNIPKVLTSEQREFFEKLKEII